MVNAMNKEKGPVYAEMEVATGITIKFQFDCGATVNVIPLKYIQDKPLDE